MIKALELLYQKLTRYNYKRTEPHLNQKQFIMLQKSQSN